MKNMRPWTIAFCVSFFCLLNSSATILPAYAENAANEAKEPNEPNEPLPALGEYISPSDVHPFGKAPHLKSKLVSSQEERIYVLTMTEEDDVISGIAEFAEKEKIQSGYFEAIGAVSKAALGYFEVKRKEYKVIRVNEQTEVASLIGNIAKSDAGGYIVHAHAVLGLANGIAQAGHLLYGLACPTVEVILTETEQPFTKAKDEATNLMLMKP